MLQQLVSRSTLSLRAQSRVPGIVSMLDQQGREQQPIFESRYPEEETKRESAKQNKEGVPKGHREHQSTITAIIGNCQARHLAWQTTRTC